MRNGASAKALLENTEPQTHIVQLYGADDRHLVNNVSRYLCEGLKRGDGLLVISTAEHWKAFARQIGTLGVDPDAAARGGQLRFLDARDALAQIVSGAQPDWDRFCGVVEAAIRELWKRPDLKGLRAYGEMVGLLWKAGKYSAAIRLEKFWNKLLRSNSFNLVCAYPIDIFGNEFQIAAIDAVLCSHTHLLPAGSNGNLESSINQAMDEILGTKVEGVRRLIKTNHTPAWGVVPSAEGVILWLRNHLPDSADEILTRARKYYQVSNLRSTFVRQ